MTMPPIRMTPEEWLEVASILRQHLAAHRVWAFGSRATGIRLKPFSDLDLAVSGTLSWDQRASIAEAFDESLLPFKVDVVELERAEPSFRSRIQPDFVALPITSGTLSPVSSSKH